MRLANRVLIRKYEWDKRHGMPEDRSKWRADVTSIRVRYWTVRYRVNNGPTPDTGTCPEQMN
jgi:hypothetical protein